MGYNYPQFYTPRPVISPQMLQQMQLGMNGGQQQPGQMTPAQMQKLIEQLGKQNAAPGGGSAAGGSGGGGIASGGAGAGGYAAFSGGDSALATPSMSSAFSSPSMLLPETGAVDVGGGAAGTGAAGAAAPGTGMASIGATALPIAAAAAGTYLAGKSAQNILKDKKDNSAQGLAGRAQLAITSGGTSEIAKALGIGHKSTKQSQKDNWSDLAGNTDPAVADYAKQYQTYLDSDQAKTDASKKFDKNNLTPEQVWGGAGILQNIPGWLTKYSADQRRQASQKFIDNGLIDQKHGDIVLTDADKANALMNDIANGGSNTMQVSKPGTNKVGSASSVPSGILGALPASVKGVTPQFASNTSSGHWEDSSGKPVVGDIDPGFTMGNKFVPDVMTQQRKDSPGFKNGKRINYARR